MMVSVIILTCAVLVFELGITAIMLDVLSFRRRQVSYRGLAGLLLRPGRRSRTEEAYTHGLIHRRLNQQ